MIMTVMMMKAMQNLDFEVGRAILRQAKEEFEKKIGRDFFVRAYG